VSNADEAITSKGDKAITTKGAGGNFYIFLLQRSKGDYGIGDAPTTTSSVQQTSSDSSFQNHVDYEIGEFISSISQHEITRWYVYKREKVASKTNFNHKIKLCVRISTTRT